MNYNWTHDEIQGWRISESGQGQRFRFGSHSHGLIVKTAGIYKINFEGSQKNKENLGTL